MVALSVSYIVCCRYMSNEFFQKARGGFGPYDFEQNVTSSKGLAFLLLPCQDTSLCHRWRHGRHLERGYLAATA